MGEKEETKNDVETKVAEGGEMKAVEPIIVVLKMNLHCEGCAKKVRRSINHFEGVENVKVDYATKKLTVTGNVDPTWLQERVELKTKKKVSLIISPQPIREDAATIKDGTDKKSDEDLEKKDDDNTSKESVVKSVVMKIRLHCGGCAHKIKRIILKNIEGVKVVDTNLEKNLVTVIGTIDVKALTTYLKEKLQRGVEVIHPKTDDVGGDRKAKEGGEAKKEKCEGGVDGDTKETQKESGGENKEEKTKPNIGEQTIGVEGTKVEINKLTIHTFNPQTHYAIPMHSRNYVENDQDYTMQMYRNQSYPSTSSGYMMQYTHENESSSNNRYAILYSEGPPQYGYISYYTVAPPPPPPVNINDQIFSDENPDGCSVM